VSRHGGGGSGLAGTGLGEFGLLGDPAVDVVALSVEGSTPVPAHQAYQALMSLK